MGKRKAGRGGTSERGSVAQYPESSKYAVEETFADSEDDFYIGRDKILLEESPAQKKRRKLNEEEQYLQPSDEEVLHADDDSEDEAYESENPDLGGSDSDVTQNKEEEDDTRGWGTSKSDYYNADVVETEADALEEEAEARRLQQKQVQTMVEADFGFDEAEWTEPKDHGDSRRTAVEKLPELQISDETPVTEKLKILKSRYPEFAPLARDFTDLEPLHQDMRLAAEATLVVKKHKVPSRRVTVGRTSPAVMKLRALSAYLSAIAMYFSVLSSPQNGREGQISAMSVAELRDHPVMEMLVNCRQLWESVKDLKQTETEEENSEPEQRTNGSSTEKATARLPSQLEKSTSTRSNQQAPRNPTARAKSSLSDGSEDDEFLAPVIIEMPDKMKKRKERRNDLETLLAHSKASNPDPEKDQPEFGDEVPLTAEEAAEKARRKKSLRFYSSQIIQKSNKRGAASRDAGGDDDLPRKERLRDRQARLLEQAEKRGRQAPDLNEQLDNEDAKEVNHSGSDEYYDLVAAKSQQKKAEKKARADAYAEAARQGAQVFEEEKIGTDGKRAITYAIEKNKGLMPRRKKDVRNPRVKKRKKFEEKMKKLGSVRQVYKGGEGRGGYGGELTGIKMNLVKSVKL